MCLASAKKESTVYLSVLKIKIFSFVMFIYLMGCPILFGQEKLTVGVAANFMVAFQEVAHEFENKAGVRINATYTSTGNLYAQIINGAPYDIFLAADETRPERLFEEGLAYEPFVYAQGRAVLWTANKKICAAGDWQKAMLMQEVNKISIANPETAPYGAAVITALKITGTEEVIRKRLVFAQNVVQSFQYAHTESVDAGFCALSAVFSEEGGKGCYFVVDQAPVIVQKACVLKSSKKRDAADAFVRFLSSPESQSVKKKYGYE